MIENIARYYFLELSVLKLPKKTTSSQAFHLTSKIFTSTNLVVKLNDKKVYY